MSSRLPIAVVTACALAFPNADGIAAPAVEDLIGTPAAYVTVEQDTLLDVARQFDLGYVEIRAANPDLDPWLPGADRLVRLPTAHIIPAAPRRGIVINLAELRLYWFPERGAPRTFPLGIGGEGKETPLGRTSVSHKRAKPTWIPTRSERKEDPDLPNIVPPGPDNPMGDFALYLGWRGYAIHGTNKPYSIGRRDSHGCIRMYPEDVEVLFREVAPGTSVTVVHQPAKVGWSHGELYLEVHPRQDEADLIESGEQGGPLSAQDVNDLVAKAAGNEAAHIDWYQVHRAAIERTGAAIRVTRSAPRF
jgi:L,D-transpeptidase ErfK/SrfK